MKIPDSLRRQGGFSIVELMVSVVVGLLALMFATRMIATSEQNKQSALGGSDSMQNGMLAMFSISADAAQSGWGLNDPLLSGCDTVFSDTKGYALAPAGFGGATIHPLGAVVIESNGSAPDRISLYSGTSMSGTGTLRIVTNYTTGINIDVDRVPYGFSKGEVIVAAPDSAGAGQCALAQISSDPSTLAKPPALQTLQIAPGGSMRFNSGNLGVAFKSNQSRLFNLGPADKLSFHTWSLSNGFLQMRSTDLAGSSNAAASVVDNIVSLKAEYGFDTSSAGALDPTLGQQILQWSTSMIDADHDGVPGSMGDYQRITALRIAVVARSRSPERPTSGSTCTATTAKPVVFANAEPLGITAVPITVDVAVAGDTVDWKCYRYRVFETIVPLRNLSWRPV